MKDFMKLQIASPFTKGHKLINVGCIRKKMNKVGVFC